LTHKEFYKTWIVKNIQGASHLEVYIKDSGTKWSEEAHNYWRAMFSPKPQYKTDLTMSDILERDAFTRPVNKKIKRKGK